MASYALSRTSGENLINGCTYSASGATISSGNYSITIYLTNLTGSTWSSTTPYVFSAVITTSGGSLGASGSTYITNSSSGSVNIVGYSDFNSTVTISSITITCTNYPSGQGSYVQSSGGSVNITAYTPGGGGGGGGILSTPSPFTVSCNGITGTEIYVQKDAPDVLLRWGGSYPSSEVRAYYIGIRQGGSWHQWVEDYYRYYNIPISYFGTIGETIDVYINAQPNYDSSYSMSESAYVYIHVISNALSAPTNVRLDDTVVSPSDTTTLRWDVVNSVANNNVTGYTIYKNDVAIGTENNTNAYTVTANSVGGQSDVFKVVANGSVSDSAKSSGVTLNTCTNPVAPTVVLSSSAIDPDTDVTLSWSGAEGGSSNPIAGYEVYKRIGSSGSFVKEGNTLGTNVSSITVRSSPNQGEVYYYKIRVLGTVRNSYTDSEIVSLTSYIYEQVGAPSVVTLNPSVVPVGGSATLTWGSGIDRTYVTVVGYDIYRSNSPNSGYEKIGSTIIGNSTTVYAPDYTSYYKIKSIASVSGYDSDLSTVYATLTRNLAPTVPTGFTVDNPEYNLGLLTFSWNASTDPEGNAIHYKLEMSYNNTVTEIASDIVNTNYSVDLSSTIERGTSATFYVYACDDYSVSDPSQGIIVTRVEAPSSNDIELVNYVGNVCYSQYPKLIYKVKRRLRISVDGWLISNSSLIERNSYFILTCANRQVPESTDISDNISISFTMNITDEYGNVGTATQTLTVALPEYTTDIAVVNTYVKASHVNNLRTIVSNHYKFMTSSEYPSWQSGSIVAGDTSLGLWLTHLYELRSCVEAIVNFMNEKLGSIVIQAPIWQVVNQNIPNAFAMNQIWTYVRDNL